MPDEPDEERIGFDEPGTFDENLRRLLEVDPEAVENGEEEPPQE